MGRGESGFLSIGLGLASRPSRGVGFGLFRGGLLGGFGPGAMLGLIGPVDVGEAIGLVFCFGYVGLA